LGGAVLCFALALALLPQAAQAAGTPPGTVIANQSTVSYSVGTVNFTTQSNLITITVVERLEVTVVSQDAGPITVSPGAQDQALTFVVTNTGNGTEAFSLVANANLAGDDFDPTLQGIYLDDGDGVWEGIDQEILYIPGVNDPVLAAGAGATVYVVSDIGTDVTDGQTGNISVQARATTVTGTATPGTLYPGGGDGGVDAVVGFPSGTGNTVGGSGTVVGTYVASNVSISAVKSVIAVVDPWGGANPVPGAAVTYQITVTVSGSGTAANVTLSDPIPANTTYQTSSLKLNGASLTDANDGDAGDVGQTAAGEVTVRLGTMTQTSAAQSVQFTVVIN